MKSILRNFLLICLLMFLSSLASGVEVASSAENKISLDFKDASLKDVLKAFSMQSGLNFIASEKIEEKKITLYMESVSVSDALDTILRANNLTYEQPEGSNILIVKKLSVPEVETITRIYSLNYADATMVKELFSGMNQSTQLSQQSPEGVLIAKPFIQGVLSEYGKIAADKRTNSIIVTDIPTRFPMIEETITKLDEATPQVMIEAEILEVATDYLEKIGLELSETGFMTFTGPTIATRNVFGQNDRFSGLADSSTEYGTLSAGNFTATLNLLKKDTETKILARPKVLTLSNQTAEIKITAETAVASITEEFSNTDRTTTKAERMETGVKLIVTPIVNKDGYVTIDVAPEVTEPKDSIFFSGTYVDPHTRSAKATIRVKDGDTIVLGGLIKNDSDVREKKIPILGDIPFLGRAFKYNYESKQSKELIIFITPHVVKDYYYTLKNDTVLIERESSREAVNRDEAIEKTLEESN